MSTTMHQPDRARSFASRCGPGVYYGWIIVADGAARLDDWGRHRMASGVMIKPLEGEFGWDRASISLALAIGLLAERLRRAVRWSPLRSLRTTPGRAWRARADGAGHRRHDRDAYHLRVDTLVGPRRRPLDRGAQRHARGGRREPLVRVATRSRDRAAGRRRLGGPTDLHPAPDEPDRQHRLACRADVDARPARAAAAADLLHPPRQPGERRLQAYGAETARPATSRRAPARHRLAWRSGRATSGCWPSASSPAASPASA